MELNFFKDKLFDILNECDSLEIAKLYLRTTDYTIKKAWGFSR